MMGLIESSVIDIITTVNFVFVFFLFSFPVRNIRIVGCFFFFCATKKFYYLKEKKKMSGF
jgi:hypothetical protein